MSALTKIFIVLLVVFSIAFAMSTISFVAQTHDWRTLAQDMRKQRDIMETNMVNLTASQAAAEAAWLDRLEQQRQRTAQLEEELQDQRQQISDLRAEVATLEAEKKSAQAHSQNLAGQLKLALAGRQKEQEQRESLQDRNIELEKRNLDLNERVNELTAQMLVLVEAQRQYEQQINILKQEKQKLAGTGAAGTQAGPGEAELNVVPMGPVAQKKIHGRLLDVSGNLATVSVGSSDGVEPDMIFIIYRGDTYIGDLRITDVEPEMAAGKIIRTEGTPRVNDLVTDETHFGVAG